MITLLMALASMVLFGVGLFYNTRIIWFWLWLTCFITTLVGFTWSESYNEYKEVIYSTPLENLKDNTYITGNIRMMLGSGNGNLKQEYEYTMYVRTADGARLVRLPVDKCRIIYTDGVPKLETVKKVYILPNGFMGYFLIPKDEAIGYYNIKVPRNSIDGVFRLDAE